MKRLFKIFTQACVYFTITEFILLIIADKFLTDGLRSGTLSNFLTLNGTLLWFAAAFVIAALGLIFEIKNLSGIVKRVLHYFACFAAIYVIFALVGKKFEASNVVVFLVLYTVIYIVLALAGYIVKQLGHRKEDDGEYKSMFN